MPTDDGTCDAHTTESSCLDRVSALDSTRTYCQWDSAWESDPGNLAAPTQCSFAETGLSWRSVVIVAILVSLATSVVMAPLDYLFDILAAPVADDEKLAQQESTGAAIVRTGRRMSTAAVNTGRRLSTAAVSAVSSAAAAVLGLERKPTLKAGSATILIPESTLRAAMAARASAKLLRWAFTTN